MDVQAVSEQVPGRHKSYNIQIIYEVAGRSATQNCKLHMFNNINLICLEMQAVA